jgi:hypothetical protein
VALNRVQECGGVPRVASTSVNFANPLTGIDQLRAGTSAASGVIVPETAGRSFTARRNRAGRPTIRSEMKL